MRLIEGVEILDHVVHSDGRGDLVAFEEWNTLPFPLERVFFMQIPSRGIERGGHANSCDEFIIALNGSVSISVDNGIESAVINLNRFDRGLWVKPGVVIRLSNFMPATLLLVCASARYCETLHFDRPQPQRSQVELSR